MQVVILGRSGATTPESNVKMILKKIELKAPRMVERHLGWWPADSAGLLRGGGISIILPLVLFFFFFPKKVFAQVVVNEVMWMGSSKSARDEWIELKNISEQKIQLNGWRIDNLLRDNGTFTFPSEPAIEISGGGFLLVSYYSKADGVVGDTTILNNPGLVWRCNDHPSCSTFSLANSGNGDLVLRNSEGREIDRAVGNPWSAGKKESGSGICYSMERINPLVSGSDPNNWKTATEAKNLISGVFDKATPEGENSMLSPTLTSTPTPTQISATATPVPTNTPAPSSYDNIFISEFMADPGSGDEWVELYNDNDGEVNLVDWHIGDLVGSGNQPRPISGTISGNSYRRFFIGGSFLNNGNSGDDVCLLDGSQTQKDQKSYSSTTKGKTWSKDSSGNWCQTDPTPDSSNPICPLVALTATPTPTRTLTVTPTPVNKLNVTPTLSQILNEKEDELSKIMGNKAEEKPVVLGEQISSTQAAKIIRGKEKVKITAAIFIIGGLVLLGLAGFFIFKEKYNLKNNLVSQNNI